ncbi:lipopolysaccharide 3-alpha-galactosyltransferase [Cedecea lapagei]|jgi:UDP-glucose:(glucosyl)LPS alpha-1,3-glucosyltransferase/UDP-D-galactose:(glucosyl)LPS alpha-1,3-D-galactosyltransferase|uniref:lipopolysaccharide 3-alpha-galactosyltransferase n=1 Tax=Cedecea lapagei TaxID=158823 RepID=UPI001BCEEFE9|nr:lipopolysaccharide 3-alpha-galactosyltransferase [Cedecea lapagei]
MSQFSDEDIILSVFDFNYQEKNAANVLNIAFGIDKNFLFGCGVAISSVLLSNASAFFEFHVFTDSFSEADKARFEALAKQYKTHINIYVINCEKLKSLPSTKNWSYATYFRFIIADYLYHKVDKLLYLDADIACKGSIQPLVDYIFAENEIAAVVVERDIEWWSNRASTLSTPELVSGYFNAGFLLININEWNINNISYKAIEMLRDPQWVEKITHLDQDVLNVLLVGKVKFIEGKYNTRFSINYELKDNVVNPVNDETVFIHYVGPTKPWHDWGTYPVSQSFLTAKEASPWRNVELLKPINSHQYRYSAKHKFNQKLYLQGLSNYVNYYVAKFKE